MSKDSSVNYNTTVFGIPWLLIFIVIKVAGTALANWSWLWVFLPVVPVLIVALKALHLL